MVQARNMLDAAPDGLLARPLSARSVIASLLLGMHPPRASAALLGHWCELFGIAGGTTRVALSRMRASGEIVTIDGVNELAGPLLARQAHQDWSLRPDLVPWSGEWRVAMVAGERRAADDRHALRTAMRRLRYAERREGVWLRPDNLPTEAAPAGAHEVAEVQCSWWRGQPDDDPTALASELFALERWAARAATFCDRVTEATERLRSEEFAAIADAFVLGTAALQHVRRDPLLPPALLPDDWPGDRLRVAYGAYRAAFVTASAAWFRAAASR
jgi:phenylacetic acid degradation operon negative regulatory protein